MNNLSSKLGYKILRKSNNEIIPVTDLDYEDNQKIVIFDDYICEKNQKKLIEYFMQGRHKNCSVIYLSQSFYRTPIDIRINCSHFCLYESPSRNLGMISNELIVDKKKI
ncbi:unnamed protein product [Porites lobata]|uniref:Uncharacterized protein n=1 Tax=Porites lobata TaxID=104759 RepID=A0ABN8QY55_9CNID|nr:unnamed protein product [Porites lobata]